MKIILIHYKNEITFLNSIKTKLLLIHCKNGITFGTQQKRNYF